MRDLGSGREIGGEEQSKSVRATQQAREKAREVAGQARGQAMERTREQLDQRSTQAGEQVTSIAQAVRQSGEQLRSQGKERPAGVIEQLADRAEQLGTYLKESDGDRILGDLQRYAQRQPWLVAVGGFVAGLVGSRFLKASSARQQGDGRPAGEYATYTPPTYEAGVETPAVGPTVAPGPVPPVVEPAVPPSATERDAVDVVDVEVER